MIGACKLGTAAPGAEHRRALCPQLCTDEGRSGPRRKACLVQGPRHGHIVCIHVHTEHSLVHLANGVTATPGSPPIQPAGAHLMHARDARLHHGPPRRADLAHAAHAGDSDGAGGEVARQRVSGRPCTARPTSLASSAEHPRHPLHTFAAALPVVLFRKVCGAGQTAHQPRMQPTSTSYAWCSAQQDYVLGRHHTRQFSTLPIHALARVAARQHAKNAHALCLTNSCYQRTAEREADHPPSAGQRGVHKVFTSF